MKDGIVYTCKSFSLSSLTIQILDKPVLCFCFPTAIGASSTEHVLYQIPVAALCHEVDFYYYFNATPLLTFLPTILGKSSKVDTWLQVPVLLGDCRLGGTLSCDAKVNCLLKILCHFLATPFWTSIVLYLPIQVIDNQTRDATHFRGVSCSTEL